MKKMFLALKLNSNPKTNPPVSWIFPKGCRGVVFAFSSIKAGKEFMGKDTKFAEIEEIKE